MVKIYVEHRTYEKVGKTWSLVEDYGKKGISRKEYDLLASDKWKGDRRSYTYTPLGFTMVRLVNIEPSQKKMKSVREFTFEG